MTAALLLAAGPPAPATTLREAYPDTAVVRDVTFDASGERIFVLVKDKDACALETWRMPATRPEVAPLKNCPAGFLMMKDGTLLLTSSRTVPHASASWLTADGEWIQDRDAIVNAVSRSSYIRKARSILEWVSPSGVTALPAKLEHARILSGSSVVIGLLGDAIVTVNGSGAVRKVVGDLKELESFAVSPDEKDLVLSSRRASGHDVALVALATGKVDWIQPDPADEVGVTWAPRGNKVSYLMQTFSGPVIRTVHVPTGFQLPVELLMRHVTKLAWDPKAERFAVVSSSPSASDRIDVMKYNGEERVVARPPDATVTGEPERLPSGGGEGVLIRPASLLYHRRYPLTVWLSSDPSRWSAARTEGFRESMNGMIVTRRSNLTARFWEAIAGIPWADPRAITIVSTEPVTKKVADGYAARLPGVRIVAPAAPGSKASVTGLRGRGELIVFRTHGKDVVEFEAARQLRQKRKGLLKRNGDR